MTTKLHKYSCISNIRPILIIVIRDHLYYDGFKVKEVTQEKYKSRSYNKDERVLGLSTDA